MPEEVQNITKIEQAIVVTSNMSELVEEWIENRKEYRGAFCDPTVAKRERGDGDSGAESKDPNGLETSQSSASSEEDFAEIKQALADITREVHGDENAKGDKSKASKIPVRLQQQSQLTNLHVDDLSLEYYEITESDVETSETQTEISCKHLHPSKHGLEEATVDVNDISSATQQQYTHAALTVLPNLPGELMDILADLRAVSEAEMDDANAGAAEDSLSPRAPLALLDDMDLSYMEHIVLEAPEEFRCTAEVGEPEPASVERDDCDAAAAPETSGKRCGSLEEEPQQRKNETDDNNSSIICIRNDDTANDSSGCFVRETMDNRVRASGGGGADDNDQERLVPTATPARMVAVDERDLKAAEVSDSACGAGAISERLTAAAQPSIEAGVARCAQAPRCSRDSTAEVRAALIQERPQHHQDSSCASGAHSTQKRACDTSDTQYGANTAHQDDEVGEFSERAVYTYSCNTTSRFECSPIPEESCESDSQSEAPEEQQHQQAEKATLLQIIHRCAERIEAAIAKENAAVNNNPPLLTTSISNAVATADTESDDEKLSSRNLNKGPFEGRSRLKLLESKLKEAGIIDTKTSDVTDASKSAHLHTNWRKSDTDQSASEDAAPDESVDEEDINKTNQKQVVDKSETGQEDDAAYDDNQNIVEEAKKVLENTETQSGDTDEEDDEEFFPAEDQTDLARRAGGRCEFDVRNLSSFGEVAEDDFYVVYDELEEEDEDNKRQSSDDDDDVADEHYHIITRELVMRGDCSNSNNTMGTGDQGGGDHRTKKHNPDQENLKSLLKKPGKRDHKKNRVIFNENKNEFFDADYIILIREECDYDEDDEDGICTCNQHEMVRLTCCEPNCNCNVYEGYADSTPQSPKFAPPLEFVDAVTLSPPEGYKDMELGEQQLLALQQMARRGQRVVAAPVCRDCSASHEEEAESVSGSDEECHQAPEEKEKTDQSQQTTPTTPPADSGTPTQQRYILETITMTTVTERRIMREAEEAAAAAAAAAAQQQPSPTPSPVPPATGSPISGILKGGRLWKQASLEASIARCQAEQQQATDSSITSDEEGSCRRSVRFIESDEPQVKRVDVCDGADDDEKPMEEDNNDTVDKKPEEIKDHHQQQQQETSNNSVSPDSTEMMLTFKLGNHVLISNNSLRPNSAMRQLFPCTKPLPSSKPGSTDSDDSSVHQYLVTADSLRAFEEAKRAKLPQIIQSGETDDPIRRTIERNTLRRSLIRYEPRTKKAVHKTDNSLVERIKQLTCDVDLEENPAESDDLQRSSPPGEEARKSPDVNHLNIRNQDKSFSPSSSSTTSSNSSMSSTYKKLTDLFAKREKAASDSQNSNLALNEPAIISNKIAQPAPDLGNGPSQDFIEAQCPVSKLNTTSEARKQFLSTLAPLTACVSGTAAPDDFYYHLANQPGERESMASSVGTEYSLEDIDEVLKNDGGEDPKRVAPDVLAGTPSASESGDELAMFVQQDASRIERIKKRYQPESTAEEDDEHDDYGFNRRPSVRGIKPRFGSTTEILQQIQNQLQPPNPQLPPRTNNHISWPYYSETSLSGVDNPKTRNLNQNHPQYQYGHLPPDDPKARNYPPYRPTSLIEENIYQNCSNQRCSREMMYRSNVNIMPPPVMRIGGNCAEYYQSLPRVRTGRPESPPPMEISRNYHQTMVLIPYNHIEGYHQPAPMSPNPHFNTDPCYARLQNNQMNKRYSEGIYHGQSRIIPPTHVDDPHYQSLLKMAPKHMVRVPYSAGQPVQLHLMAPSRSESPMPGQFATARATQTPAPTMSTCNYYPGQTRYRPAIGPANSTPPNGTIWLGEGQYVSKVNRHSFPTAGPRYPVDNISLTDSDSQTGGPPNGYRQSIETVFPAHKDMGLGSPTKPSRFIERGVPEGAASVSPQDSSSLMQNTGSAVTSPTSPQNPQAPNNANKPMFYAMNV